MPETNPSKIVLITGTSSGFGLYTAAHLASKDYRVIATMRDLNKKNDLVNEIAKRGGSVDILQLDVTDKASVREAIKEIATKYGYLDVCVNNAGIGIGGFFEDLTDEEIREVMETNFYGVQTVTREVIPLMRPRRSGKFINISSVSGFSTSPAFGAYNASKWALEAFSESLRYELKLFGIDVLLIEPGTYRTKIFEENSRYATHFNDPESPYYDNSQHLKQLVQDYVQDCHKDIEEIPQMVEKLIIKRNPQFRNIPDFEGQIQFTLRNILPFRLYSWIIQKTLFHRLKKNKHHRKPAKIV